MGEPVTVLFCDRLERTEVATFILERGGWAEEGAELGGLAVGDAHVLVFFDPEEPERPSIMEIVGEKLLKVLHKPYKSSLIIEAGRAEGSADISIKLAIALCERWQPSFVFCSEQLFSLDDLVRMQAQGKTFVDVQLDWLSRIAVRTDEPTS